MTFLLTEKENEFIRFHAAQSLVVFAGLTILTMIPLINWLLWPFITVFGFILWLICIVKAYQGERFELPIVGELAKKLTEKVNK